MNFELEKLDKEVSYLDLKTCSRKEDLLLLKQYLRLLNTQKMTFQNAYEIAFKLIREFHIRKFLSVLYLARFYPTLEDLARAGETMKRLRKLLTEKSKKKDSSFYGPSQYLDEKEKLDEREKLSEIPEEESLEIEDTKIENAEEEINLIKLVA